MSLRRLLSLLPLLGALLLPSLHAADSSPLSGQWRYDATRSTELSPWKSFDLTLAIDGDKVTIHRRLGWARRDYEDTTEFRLNQPPIVVPAPWWPDNRHLGAYATGDKTKRVSGVLLEKGRILRLNTDQVLGTQQGPREVNVLTDFKVSVSGTQLTVIELRSTRSRPIVYVFNRVPAATK
ncbi:hypothetical protein [Opitutus sp. ER46]|uniref:hypothetical protein n=1 Tax=Opitutus sp. ER46 TaxID=2161864 RepID=UPI000D31E158|nr:hypothetical protein [Opitutus sp. ER46]PTX94479.1 hypothetical protein DB354_12095 [Opitutus sp. ER46]